MDPAATAICKIIRAEINQILTLRLTEPATLVGLLVKIDTLLGRLEADGNRHGKQEKVSKRVRPERSTAKS